MSNKIKNFKINAVQNICSNDMELSDVIVCTYGNVLRFSRLVKEDYYECKTNFLPDTVSAAEKTAYKNTVSSTPFEMLMLLAAGLAQDKMPVEQIMNVGTTKYNGEFNPYDWSWFEMENEFNGKDPLDYIREWYKAYEANRVHFRKYYDLAKEMHIKTDWLMYWVYTFMTDDDKSVREFETTETKFNPGVVGIIINQKV